MTKKFINFQNIKPGKYEVWYKSQSCLGLIFAKEDGFYDFWPDLKGGCWSAYVLREIADKLDEINAPYEKELNEYFEKQKEKECEQ